LFLASRTLLINVIWQQWLREDFIQEKRWKVAAAFTVSRWVMEWHNATDKAALCVKVGFKSPEILHV
jgi:hypothetical protein